MSQIQTSDYKEFIKEDEIRTEQSKTEFLEKLINRLNLVKIGKERKRNNSGKI